jgi:uncharacterized protein YfbU (UPF0304 family)
MEMTPAEKLTLIMLSEIYEHLGIKGRDGIDATFVRSMIERNQTWALSWQYPFIFDGKAETPAIVGEVVDFLDMWSLIEEAYERLSAEDQEQVRAEAHLDGDPLFAGFDRHEDARHVAAARCLLEDLGKFQKFNRALPGRTRPYPHLLNAYRSMYRVFDPIRKKLVGRGLTATEMIDILKAPMHSSGESEEILPDFPDIPPSEVN